MALTWLWLNLIGYNVTQKNIIETIQKFTDVVTSRSRGDSCSAELANFDLRDMHGGSTSATASKSGINSDKTNTGKKIPVNLEIVDDNEYCVSEDQREQLKYKNFTPREEVDHDTEAGAKTQLRKEANDVVMKNEQIITVYDEVPVKIMLF